MKVVVAIDSFKGSVNSLQAGAAVKAGILNAIPNAQVITLPLADGGEGTTDAITAGLGGELISVQVTGPLGEKFGANQFGTNHNAQYGIVPQKNLCVIEMSQAAGLPLVPQEKRNPLNTTTRGVGQMICDALDKGYRDFLIGIGGSATNDGGIGMLSALGCVFKNAKGETLFGYGREVEEIDSIDISKIDARLFECRIRVACDVKNPLCGANGASAIYGPQKGATPQIVGRLDAALKKFAQKTAALYGKDFSELEGAGAAGGLGFAFAAYLNATLCGGVALVLDAIGFENAVQGADVVVTGEGRLDGQTAMGKVPIGVAQIAKRQNKTPLVLAVCGCATSDAVKCNQCGIDAFFPILQTPCSLQDAMNTENAAQNLTRTAEQIFRLIKLPQANL